MMEGSEGRGVATWRERLVAFERDHTWLAHLAVIAAATLAVLARAIGKGFICDDFEWLEQAKLLTTLEEHLEYNYWGEHMPAFTLLWRAVYLLFGAEPVAFDALSVLAHLAASIGVYALARQVLAGAPRWALAAALLFALHPAHDEVVLWDVAVSHILVVAMGSALLLLVGRTLRPGRVRFAAFAAALLLYPAMLLTKEFALLWPALIGLYVLLVAARTGPVRAFVWSGALAAPFALQAWYYLKARAERWSIPDDKTEELLDLEVLGERLFPYTLHNFVPVPFADFGRSELEPYAPFAAVGLLAVTAASVWFGLVRRGPHQRLWRGVLLGVGFYLAAIVPLCTDEVGFKRRYSYVASVGSVLALAGVGALAARRPRLRRPVAALAAVATCASGLALAHRVTLYRGAGALAAQMRDDITALTVDHPERVNLLLPLLPYKYAGDYTQGIYVHQNDDLQVAVRSFSPSPIRRVVVWHWLRYAEEVSSTFEPIDGSTLQVSFRFQTDAGFDEAVDNLDDNDWRSVWVLEDHVTDADSRDIHARLRLRSRARGLARNSRLLRYSDGRFHEGPEWPYLERWSR